MFKTPKYLINQKVNSNLTKSKLPYLTNGDSVKRNYWLIGFTIIENEGVGHLKTPF